MTDPDRDAGAPEGPAASDAPDDALQSRIAEEVGGRGEVHDVEAPPAPGAEPDSGPAGGGPGSAG